MFFSLVSSIPLGVQQKIVFTSLTLLPHCINNNNNNNNHLLSSFIVVVLIIIISFSSFFHHQLSHFRFAGFGAEIRHRFSCRCDNNAVRAASSIARKVTGRNVIGREKRRPKSWCLTGRGREGKRCNENHQGAPTIFFFGCSALSSRYAASSVSQP